MIPNARSVRRQPRVLLRRLGVAASCSHLRVTTRRSLLIAAGQLKAELVRLDEIAPHVDHVRSWRGSVALGFGSIWGRRFCRFALPLVGIL